MYKNNNNPVYCLFYLYRLGQIKINQRLNRDKSRYKEGLIENEFLDEGIHLKMEANPSNYFPHFL